MDLTTNKTILITGVGGAAGVYLIKHLQRNNCRVIAVDANSNSYGFLHGDANYLVPNCLDENYIPTIQKICVKENVNFILPLIDEELLNMKALETKDLHVVCPNAEFIALCLDKYILMQKLEEIGVPIPKSGTFSNIKFLKFPLIVKPKTGRGSRNVYPVSTQQELERISQEHRKTLEHYIVQEKIEGDEYTVSVVVNAKNELLSIVPKKIILKKGITNIAVTEHNTAIAEVCKKIVDVLKPSNSFNVQLMVHTIDYKPYIFEINPRYSTTTTLTIQAGVDEVMLPINCYLGASQGKYFQDFQEGVVVVRSTLEDFMSYNEYKNKVNNIFREVH